MKISKELNLIADMRRSLEFYDMEECDPDVAELLNRADHILEESKPVDTEMAEWLKEIQKANLHEMT